MAATQFDTTLLLDGSLSADASGRAKMAAGFFSADATGRGKFASGFVNTDLLADGALSADASGRAKIADDFFNNTTTVAAKFSDASIGDAILETPYIKADGTRAFTGDQSMGGNQLTNLGAPAGANDATTKAFVEALVYGARTWKDSVRAATVSNLVATRTGNTLTADANGAIGSIDGVAVSVGNRVLIKAQTLGEDNGIYTLTDAGSPGTPYEFERATDADEDSEVKAGLSVWVTEGTAYEDTAWVLTTDDTIVVNTTELVFAQFSSGAGNTYVAGAGLTESPAFTFNVASANSAIVVNANDIELFLNATASGLEISSGLRVDVADDSLLIDANGLSVKLDAAGAISVDVGDGLQVNVDDVGIEINTNALRLKDLGTTFAKLAAAVTARLGRYDRREDFTGTGSQVNFDLAVTDADQTAGGILVYRAGVLMREGGANDYTLSDNGGAGGVDRVIFNVAPPSGQNISIVYKRTGSAI
jgi:hypothetical protein